MGVFFSKWSSSLLLLLCMFVFMGVFFFKVELITPSSLYVCFCVMGVAHFSLFWVGERERERERERGEREEIVGQKSTICGCVFYAARSPSKYNNNLTKALCFRRGLHYSSSCSICSQKGLSLSFVSLLFCLLGFSRISLSIGQTKDIDTEREVGEGELRQTVFES